MGFSGFIESLTPGRITGWAVYSEGDQRIATDVRARFRTLGIFPPTERLNRRDGLVGYVFALPPAVAFLDWPEFIADFEGVEAIHEIEGRTLVWSVPILKSAVLDAAGNQTTVHINPLRTYSGTPKPNGRIAVHITAYNEELMLSLCTRYYAKEFGAENVFVIDHGSNVKYDKIVPDGTIIVRVPRDDEVDDILRMRLAMLFQRFLLEVYDSVLYVDADEFVCADPAALAGRSLRQFLLELASPVGITTGYDLWHRVGVEGSYNPRWPVLEQRRAITRAGGEDKPLISRIPLNWDTGFHRAREGGQKVEGLYLLHLRSFDLDHALSRNAIYLSAGIAQHNIALGVARRWRFSAEEIRKEFESVCASIEEAASRSLDFNPIAKVTFVPDWMREAVWI